MDRIVPSCVSGAGPQVLNATKIISNSHISRITGEGTEANLSEILLRGQPCFQIQKTQLWGLYSSPFRRHSNYGLIGFTPVRKPQDRDLSA